MNTNPEQKVEPKLDQKVATDFPKFIAVSIADQIKQADTKAFGTISIIGIVTAALLSRLNSLKASVGVLNDTWLILFGISAILILVALKAAVTVVYPRLSKPGKESFTYFGDISSITKDQFIEWGKGLTFDQVRDQTYINAYSLSKIADKKYKSLRRAMLATVLAIVWTLGVLLFS
jgi:hypothetical protein